MILVNSWELLPFDFSVDWVFDPEYGWLEFIWFPEALHPQKELFATPAATLNPRHRVNKQSADSVSV